MYDGETNTDHWLEDYCLAMKAKGSDDDFTILYICFFRAQLELGSNNSSLAISVAGCDLRSIFVGHF
jgi:hypothetical protein